MARGQSLKASRCDSRIGFTCEVVPLRKIDMKKAIEGMASCSDNARKLARDARIMYGRHRYSTALALSIISLEEIGKVWLLNVVCHAQRLQEDVDWGAFWKSWRSHDMKGGMASIIDLGLYGADAADLAKRSIILGDLAQLREQSLYVDYSSQQWHHPKEVPREWVLEILEAAESLSEAVWRECNPRRAHVLLREIQHGEINLSPKTNPFLANFLEGLQELEDITRSLNLEILGVTRHYAA